MSDEARPDSPAAASLRVAAVQASPVFLDLDATVEKTVGLIEEAGAAGVKILGFPEGFVPGHPGWVEVLSFDDRSLGLARRLFENAVEVPGAAIETIAAACGRTGVAAVVGICERRPRTTGTLYNTHVLIDAEGGVACKHQKLVPTIGERLVHGPGDTGSANSMELSGHTVTGLICGENSNPLAVYGSAVAYPTVHVASWPQHFSPDLEMQPVIEMVSRSLAYTLKAFVLNAVATIGPEMLEAYGDANTLPFLRSPEAGGRASVIGPGGAIIAEGEAGVEQLVIAEIDPGAVLAPKFVHDFAGHYNRPDLFAHLFGEPGAGADA
jgi:nitrilase